MQAGEQAAEEVPQCRSVAIAHRAAVVVLRSASWRPGEGGEGPGVAGGLQSFVGDAPVSEEGIWFLVKRTIGNLAAANLDQLATAVKRSLKQTQYRPHLIDGCLTGTGLTLTS